ncbi:serine/threonine-protein kinase-like protein CCR4 [Capsicum annuum]|uniref:serine/threonine-protein kinase-like protein CCR4 n=1 Tax=Capsicum annuum TaxID=4072 RepID=UPI0007BF54F1|nr:serine/threonine-protein kinase-like protein CCR4 [Capsicum annuum]
MYKAELEDGTTLAVRLIGESSMERFKDFENQVKIIAKLVHPNLVKIHGFYWGTEEKLVIYDFVPNDSLADARYSKSFFPIQQSPYMLFVVINLLNEIKYRIDKVATHTLHMGSLCNRAFGEEIKKDCDVFVDAYIEILSEVLDVHSCDFDTESQRARYTSLLWRYEVTKAKEAYTSDNDDPSHPRNSWLQSVDESAIVTFE